jgi:tRNA threonylcarbamoyladenosine biosynthesis protein TsaE
LARLEVDISDPAKLPVACKKLIEFAGNIKVFTFNGEMGSGKTTFIKELCKVLNSEDDFSSPTYSIVNEYRSPQGKIFHFDLYRLRKESELFDLGFEEYLQSGNYCFIEWPELAHSFFLTPYLRTIIRHEQNNRYFYAEIINS